MIIFHEGLPGSGKSYEACVNQIIPTLLKGRKVFAYIEGLNHEKFAQILEKPVEWVQEHLIQLHSDQVKTIYDHVENDSLVIIDELQDYFPSSRKPLDSDITTFVTQHRHRGIDIICMGQSHKDCHSLWKRRIDNLITFVKRDAIGRDHEYTWTTHKQKQDKFEPLNTGKGTYDSKYFGLYSSHNSGVAAIDVHKDDRTNVFKSAVFKIYIPAFAVVLVIAIGYLVYFFQKPPVEDKTEAKPIIEEQIQTVPVKVPLPSTMPVVTQPAGYLDSYLKTGRPKLSALVTVKGEIHPVSTVLEFYDSEENLKERLNVDQVQDMGYLVLLRKYGVQIIRGNATYHVTMWRTRIQKENTLHTQQIGLTNEKPSKDG